MTVMVIAVTLLLFRTEAKDFVGRITELEIFGGKFKRQLAEQQATAGSIQPPPTTIGVAVGLPSTSMVGTPTAIVGPRPSPVPSATPSTSTPAPTSNVPHTPDTQLAQTPIDKASSDPVLARAEILKWWSIAKYESTYNVIFGTQLRMLSALAQQPVTGETVSNLAPFYIEHQKLAGTSAIPFGNFASFLISNQFMRIDATGTEARAYITDLGKDFLAYISRTYGTFAMSRAY